jgi:alpha-galactosidase
MHMAQLRLRTDDGGSLELGCGPTPILAPASPLFLIDIDGTLHDRFDADDVALMPGGAGITGRIDGSEVFATWTANQLGDSAVWDCGLELENRGDTPVLIRRMDPIAARIAVPSWKTLTFHSAWGDEFRPITGTTDSEIRLDVRSGRSSHGPNPWFGMHRDGAALIVSPAWSGNWHLELAEGGRLSAGISTWQFSTAIEPGEIVRAPSVVIAAASSLQAAALELTGAVGRNWTPRSAASELIPVEWNHWWPYEDAEVTEDIIWENARIAADLGIEVSTVDAGWFGDSDSGSDWQVQRGDWHRTNTARFPSGLTVLGDRIRDAGTKAGIWIEAEAVGRAATLRTEQPEVIAHAPAGRRPDPSYRVTTVSLDGDDPTFLGYVCMGSPEGRAHVARSLDTVVRQTGAEWVKLDFNIDPDAGCTRTDHGHGAEDGLFRHYEGLYSVLDDFRAAHPEVILEACSSGGLRIDLGLARHVHCLFLSDPDHTEHHLKVLWGASMMLPPVSILHWSWSQWRGDYPPTQKDFTALGDNEFATMLRAAMIHRFGVSLRLPELSTAQLEILRSHVGIFTRTVAPFVRDGVLHRLTDVPLRDGERWPAFQLSLDGRHFVAAFRLDGATGTGTTRPAGIDSALTYTVTNVTTGAVSTIPGAVLSEGGIDLGLGGSDDAESSWLYLIETVA